MTYIVFHISTDTISFPEHACSQVKGGYSSGEMELIQACDCLAAASTLDFQREFQRRLDSRPQSIMGIERLIARVTSLTVDCRGVNISLTKAIWKLSNDMYKSVRL